MQSCLNSEKKIFLKKIGTLKNYYFSYLNGSGESSWRVHVTDSEPLQRGTEAYLI